MLVSFFLPKNCSQENTLIHGYFWNIIAHSFKKVLLLRIKKKNARNDENFLATRLVPNVNKINSKNEIFLFCLFCNGLIYKWAFNTCSKLNMLKETWK